MSELPNPAYWTDGDYGVSCTPGGMIYQASDPPWIGAKPLFTAEQVAELMEAAKRDGVRGQGDWSPYDDEETLREFRDAYCKKADG